MRITSRRIIFEGCPPIVLAVGEDLPFTIIDKSHDGSEVKRSGVLVVTNRSFNTTKSAPDDAAPNATHANSSPG